MTERSRSEAAADEQVSVSSTAQPAVSGTSPGTSSPASDTSFGTSSGTSASAPEQAKQAVQGAAEQAKQAAGDVAAQAKDQATGQLASQKDRAASSLGGVADALRQTSQNLNQNEQRTVANYVNQAADRVERFQGYLRTQDVGAIIDDVERMAREQPVLFLGSAFMLGLVAARFLKSSGQGGRYGSSYGRSRSYYHRRLRRGQLQRTQLWRP